MPLRQPANSGVGNVEQAGLVKSSDIAPKRRHPDSECEGTKGRLLGLARCASERRNPWRSFLICKVQTRYEYPVINERVSWGYVLKCQVGVVKKDP
jgi:hypothetical protein